MWQKHFAKLLRTSKFHKHAECDKCHELKTLMRRSTTAAEKARYATMFLDHQDAQTLDRHIYDEAIAGAQSGKLLCIAQDGSDQERYRVFRAMRIPKSMEGLENPAPRLKLLGSWSHGVVGCFYLVEEDVRKDSCLTVEALFTTIEESRIQLAAQGRHLPPELWVQVDNAPGENKNQHVFTCVAALVARGVFKAATIAFLRGPLSPACDAFVCAEIAFSRPLLCFSLSLSLRAWSLCARAASDPRRVGHTHINLDALWGVNATVLGRISSWDDPSEIQGRRLGQASG